MRPIIQSQPKDRSLKYENAPSALAEEGVIRLLMLDGEMMRMAQDLEVSDFTSPFLGRVFEMIRSSENRGEHLSLPLLTSQLEPAEAALITQICQKPEETATADIAMGDYIEKIKTEKLKSSAKDNLLAMQEKMREKKGYGG